MTEFKDICVRPNDSLEHIITILDETARQIVLVVDEDYKLVGTVTDGDVRRALLKGLGLSSPAHEIMNANPLVEKEGVNDVHINRKLQQNYIKQLPIVNFKGQIVDIYFLKDSFKDVERQTPVVIMAGGFGKRLMPLTKNIPKPLLKVGGKPILHTIVESLKEQGYTNIYLSINYLGEEIEDYFGNGETFGVTIQYIREKKPMGTAGILRKLSTTIDKPFIVMNGDILTKIDFDNLMQYHVESEGAATLCVREYDITIPFGVVEFDEQHLKKMIEKPIQKFHVNAGIYVLEPSTLSYIPEDSFYNMPEFLCVLIANDYNVSCFHLREYWIDIGRLDQLEKAQDEYDEIFQVIS